MKWTIKLGLRRCAACSLAALFAILALQPPAPAQADAPATQPAIHIVSFDLVTSAGGQSARHMHKIQTDRGLEFTDNLDGTRQLINEFTGMQLKLNDHDKTAVVIPARTQRSVPDKSLRFTTEDQKILKLMQSTAVNSNSIETIDGISCQKWTAVDPGKRMGSITVLPTLTTIWIDPQTGDVPKVAVTSTNPAQFTFSSVYTHFVVNPDVPDGTLSFDVPPGYTKVAESQGRGPTQRRGN